LVKLYGAANAEEAAAWACVIGRDNLRHGHRAIAHQLGAGRWISPSNIEQRRLIEHLIDYLARTGFKMR
jgi:hypothetical protein